MIRSNAGLWLLAAVSVVVFAACGDLTPTDGGSGCTSDSSCGTGKMCHPIQKVCIATCTGGSDCPSTAKTCDVMTGTTSKFCQCATDQLCGGGSTVCMAQTRTCESKCTATSCWAGASCNTTTGQCSGGGNDGGTDGGVDAGVCNYGTPPATEVLCSGSSFCNYFTHQCMGPPTCTSSNVQPDTCGNGGFCSSGNTCGEVYLPSCPAFTPGTGKTPVFDPTVNTGPVIWKIEDDAAPRTANCFQGFYIHSMYLNAYKTDGSNFPAQLTALSGIWYVKPDGSQLDLTAGLPASYYVPSGKMMRLRVYLCAQTSSSFTAGYYMTGGNEVCAVTSGGTAGTTPCTSSAQCGTLTCDTGTGICG